MTNPQFPDHTPNVAIENPKVRRVIRTIIDVIGATAFVAIAVDFAAPEIDIAWITVPVLAGYGAARSVFGFVVDNRNTPS